jgi:hypothetical protein
MVLCNPLLFRKIIEGLSLIIHGQSYLTATCICGAGARTGLVVGYAESEHHHYSLTSGLSWGLQLQAI